MPTVPTVVVGNLSPGNQCSTTNRLPTGVHRCARPFSNDIRIALPLTAALPAIRTGSVTRANPSLFTKHASVTPLAYPTCHLPAGRLAAASLVTTGDSGVPSRLGVWTIANRRLTSSDGNEMG